MAHYYASCRSNAFRVKDEEAFLEGMKLIPDIDIVKEEDGSFVLLGSNADGSGWPNYFYDNEAEDYVDIDLYQYVGQYLEDDEVAIFMEVGAEKLRYIIGYALAVNNKGEERIVNLGDIYAIAKAELTNNPDRVTLAEY